MIELEDVKKLAESLYFDLFGVADPFCAELQRAPEGHKPQDYLPGVKSVIALGARLIDSILQTTPSGIYSKHYDTVNEVLNSGAYQLAKWLEDKGYRSMTFPETDSYGILWSQYNAGYETFVPCFNHMAVAVAAGLGKLGTCGVVLTPQFGPRQRWISVVTEAPLSCGEEMKEEICLEKRGANCTRCLKACPIEAISLKAGTDVRRCWIQWTGQRDRGLACGICIKVCPIGW
ncbi:MAG: epoxyqueuosine reductase [Deltaproteobacteria bacterium]|nr:epoxyqueuosine reductase [Deltaproteobacteria bacterium]